MNIKPALTSSNIKEITSLVQANEALQCADHNTLVVFDLDDTLISPTEKFQNYWNIVLGNPEEDFTQADTAFVRQIQHDFKIHEMNQKYVTLNSIYGERIASKILSQSEFKPVEQCTLQIIKDLQMRSIKFIALTFQRTGASGEISCMQEWRIKKLLNVGIDFGQNFKEQEIVFDALIINPHHLPMFYKGILMTAFNPKGPVLKAFLDHIKWLPSNVIFFDDNKGQIESVEQEMIKCNISFQGYWYKGAKSLKPQPLNQEVVRLQFDYLKQYNDILSIDEAVIQKPKLGRSKK
jgi:hypothetical protein